MLRFRWNLLIKASVRGTGSRKHLHAESVGLVSLLETLHVPLWQMTVSSLSTVFTPLYSSSGRPSVQYVQPH